MQIGKMEILIKPAKNHCVTRKKEACVIRLRNKFIRQSPFQIGYETKHITWGTKRNSFREKRPAVNKIINILCSVKKKKLVYNVFPHHTFLTSPLSNHGDHNVTVYPGKLACFGGFRETSFQTCDVALVNNLLKYVINCNSSMLFILSNLVKNLRINLDSKFEYSRLDFKFRHRRAVFIS